MKNKKLGMIVLLFVCAVIAAGIGNTPEKRTIRYFERHKTALEEDIEKSIAGGQAVSSLDITPHYWHGEHPMIEYVVVSKGIAPASGYYGFFYSIDDTPVAFQNAKEALTFVSENEWEWKGRGDNHGRVRRLEEHWFYFEAFL